MIAQRQRSKTKEDVEIIYNRLRKLRLFQRMHPTFLQQICEYSYIEHLDKGVVLFRQGDETHNWYAVLMGSLDIKLSEPGKPNEYIGSICTLGVGTALGEAVLTQKPHSVSVITNEPCTLLRVRKEDFQEIWGKNPQPIEDIITPLGIISCIKGNKTSHTCSIQDECAEASQSNQDSQRLNEHENSVKEMSDLMRIGLTLRDLILTHDAHLIRDRRYSVGAVYRKCVVGSELVDWLITVSLTTPLRIHSRSQATGMWQVLLEEGVLKSVNDNKHFHDKYIFYRFCVDDNTATHDEIVNSIDDIRKVEIGLVHCLSVLSQLAPDAVFRLILRKQSHERTLEEVDAVYEELMHIKALSHLGNSVRKELAFAIGFESHPKKNTVLFNQGDVGKCWYIILRGSVNVVIIGKGVVCTLNEGDDFGKLALLNDAPRAATIITNEDNCHFLKVNKDDFNRILRDVEANTVRLKEHGKDVLLLCKMPLNKSFSSYSQSNQGSHYKYMVIAGTPEKMFEHILETRIDILNDQELNFNSSFSFSRNLFDVNSTKDTFLEDFLLTFIIFISSQTLCQLLCRHYKIDELNTRQEKEFSIANKKRVIRFTKAWSTVAGDAFFKDKVAQEYLTELHSNLKQDIIKYENVFEEEMTILNGILRNKQMYDDDISNRGIHKWKGDRPGSIRKMSTNDLNEDLSRSNEDLNRASIRFNAIHPSDEVISRIYCADHTYTTLKMPADSTAGAMKVAAAEKLGLNKDEGDLILVEVKSTGERVLFKDDAISIQTCLSVNGRLFVSPIDHLDALTPLPEQEGPKEGIWHYLDDINSQDIAYYLTNYSWSFFQNVHEYELIYHVLKRSNFDQITANLDLFVRFFNEIQYWVVTEICLTTNLSRRVNLIRKFIKIAGICKEHQNLSTFFAITMGLSNIAVSRLTQTWERLPNKLKRTFAQYESLVDPSRNHRKYRMFLTKLDPPIIPFPPLLLKDMTFTNEGNKTFLENSLVNFEKMHMIAQTLRIFRYCRSKPLKLDDSNLSMDGNINMLNVSPSKKASLLKIDRYIKDLNVIDNQRLLNHFSHSLEHRKV